MTRRGLHELLGSRWALEALSSLVDNPLRFSEVRQALTWPHHEAAGGPKGVSSKVLTETLARLCAAKLTEKTLGGYILTDRGASVLRWSSFPTFDWLESNSHPSGFVAESKGAQ